MTHQRAVSKGDLEFWRAELQAMKDAHMKAHGYEWEETFSVKPGRKYAKVIVRSHGRTDGGSVHSFVDMTNGNILKAASWKAPETKNPRGNIFAETRMNAVTPHGAVYLR